MSCEIIITISSIVRHGKMFRVDLITSIISESRQLWFTNSFTGRKRCIHQPSARSLASKETGVQARTHEWGHNKYFIGDVSYIWKTYGCLDQSLTLPHRAWWSLIAVNQPSSSGCALFRFIPTSMWTFHQLYTVNSPLWKLVVDWECFHWKYRLHHATSHMIAWVKASSCKQVASLCPHTATALGWAMSLGALAVIRRRTSGTPIWDGFSVHLRGFSRRNTPPSSIQTLQHFFSPQVKHHFQLRLPTSSLLMMPLCPETGGRTTLPVSLCRRCTQTAWGYPGSGKALQKGVALKIWHCQWGQSVLNS